MPQNICFKCCIKFEDVYEMFIICFICRKYFCIKCYGSHKHNNIESYYEDLYNIIKDKNDTLYKPLPICDWNTSIEVDYVIAMERMMNRYITHHRCEFITFCRQHKNMKEQFNYFFIEMILNNIFCFDIYNHILSFF